MANFPTADVLEAATILESAVLPMVRALPDSGASIAATAVETILDVLRSGLAPADPEFKARLERDLQDQLDAKFGK